MNQALELELRQGGVTSLTLPDPGQISSFYVMSMEYSGNIQFWQLLADLMAAAGQTVFRFHDSLRQKGLHLGDLTPVARERLLRLEGYGLGIFFDVEPTLNDAETVGKHKLLLLRDPRDLLVAAYRHTTSQAAAGGATGRAGDGVAAPLASFFEYLQTDAVERVVKRYQRFAEFRRQWQPNR